jgi:peptidoglycan hydrolase CwlO-like protein
MTENMIQTLTEIEDTTEILTRLESEHADLSKRMSDAANDADSAALIGLAHRRGDLPIEILSTRIRLERLYLQRDEERLPELQAEAKKLAEPIEPMLKKIAEMQREFNIASGAAASSGEDVRETKMSISDRKRTIEVLLREARNVKISPSSLQAHGGR